MVDLEPTEAWPRSLGPKLEALILDGRNPWEPMGTHGNPWEPIENHRKPIGNHGKLMGNHRKPIGNPKETQGHSGGQEISPVGKVDLTSWVWQNCLAFHVGV